MGKQYLTEHAIIFLEKSSGLSWNYPYVRLFGMWEYLTGLHDFNLNMYISMNLYIYFVQLIAIVHCFKQCIPVVHTVSSSELAHVLEIASLLHFYK